MAGTGGRSSSVSDQLPGGDHGPRAAIRRARNLARSAPAVTCAGD